MFISVSRTKHHEHSYAIIVAAQSGPQTQCLTIRSHILPVNAQFMTWELNEDTSRAEVVQMDGIKVHSDLDVHTGIW